MHKAFSLPVMEFLLPEEVPTASEESSHCQKKRDATAVKIRTATKVKKLQVIISQLEFMDIEIKQDDLNQKFLTSLAPEWLMHTIVWRNGSDLDTISLDDLYNHLKVYESEVLKKSELNSQNMAFISSAKHNSGNKEVNIVSVFAASTNVSTASPNIGVASISRDTACAYIASQSIGSQIKFEDINQIDENDMEKMDIKLNMALLSMRADRAPRSQDRGRRDNYRQGSKVEEQAPKALMAIEFAFMAKTSAESEVFNNSLCSKAWLTQVEARLAEHRNQELKYYEKIRVLEFKTESRANCIESLTKDLEFLKKEKGYSAVPPPPTQVYSPPKKYMSWTDLSKFKDDTVTDYSRPSPTIESNISYLFDYEPFDGGCVSFGQGGCNITGKGTIKTECIVLGRDFKLLDDANVLLMTPRQHNMYSINLNNIVPHKDLTCLVAKAFADECMLWHRRLGHLNFKTMNRVLEFKTESRANCIESLTKDLEFLKKEKGYSAVPPLPAQVYSPPKKDMSWTGLSEFADDTVTDYSRPAPTIESSPDDAQNRNPSVTETGALPSTISPKPFIKFVKATVRSTETKTAKVETAKHVVKYAAMYSKSSKSSNVRGNQRNWNNLKSYQLGLNFVMKKKACFNCGDFNHLAYDCSKRVKRGTSGSQNNTHKSFTPRPVVHKPYRPPMRPIRPNMNVAQPKRTSFHKLAHSYNKRPVQRTSMGSNCAKASADEGMLWHMRLGHLNFKTMNRLARHNLVRGLPFKCFENDHTCIACLKRKQHKASLTDDFSRFTWTFFLKTKDETSGILRKFITEIENLKDLKVKIIRTPQQNGVAERRNRTLIEAARTMLADAKLPVTFWAEAVNTACYV
nr:hypothetical protein [Tanacetum cinerariifolium]